MNEAEFLEALAKFAPSVRQAFIEAIQDITDNAVLAQVVKAIESGDEQAVWRALGYNPSVFNRMVSAIGVVFEQGALLTIAHLPKYATASDGIKTIMRFNMRDRRAEEWLRTESSSLVTGIEDDMRIAVRDTLQVGISQGRNPQSTALDLVGRYNRDTGHREGGIIGLGSREQAWSRNARQRLVTLDPGYFDMELRDKRFDATVARAIERGEPLPASVIDKLVDRYRDRALKFRGDTIGRTETLAALNKSEYESTRQALEQSDLPLAAATKIWDSAGDGHVRPSHRVLDEMRAQMDEPFISPTGSRMMHPGDTSLGASGKDVIGCRCRVRYKINFAYGVE